MLHLTFEELSDFVSMNAIDLSSRNLATKVLSHVRECKLCRDALGGMLDVTDVLTGAKRALENSPKKEMEK